MKKNVKTFSKILSLALVMALVLTSVMSAFGITASAANAVVTNKILTNFEEGVIPSTDAISSASRFEIATDVARGTYSLKHIGSDEGKVANYDIKGYDFTVGKTYVVSGYWYLSDIGTGTNAWFSVWEGIQVNLKSFTDGVLGEWKKFELEFTCSLENSFIRFNVANNTIYFDDIYIYEKGAYANENLPLVTDFTDLDTAEVLPVVPANINNTVHYEYNEELGKNVLVGTVNTTVSNWTSMFYIPYELKAGVTYTFMVRYNTAVWMTNSIDSMTSNFANYNQNTWRTTNIDFTATNDGQMINIYGNSGTGLGTIYFDYIVLKEKSVNNNTASYQAYDFDNINFSNALPTVIDGDTFAADLSSTGGGLNVALDYALKTGSVYRLSFDYKGTGAVRNIPNSGGWSNNMYSVEPDFDNKNNNLNLSSPDAWSNHSTVFIAQYDSTHLWLVNFASGSTLYYDNIVIEKLDISAEKQAFDFDEVSFAGISGSFTTENVDGDLAVKIAVEGGNKTFYGKLFAPLTKGKVYKLSYDYKGTGAVRFLPNAGAWNTEMYSAQFGTAASANLSLSSEVWTTKETMFVAEYASTHLCIGNFAAGTIYIDNIVIEELATDNYVNDFETDADRNLFELYPDKTVISYETDETYGSVAKLNYSGTSSTNFGHVALPFSTEAGVTYRVKLTYKSDNWLCFYFNGVEQGQIGGLGAVDTEMTEWTERFFTFTASESVSGFAIGTLQSAANLWIAEIAIETVGEAGDLDGDGIVGNQDLVLMRKWFLGAVDGYDVFDYCVDMTGEGTKNIIDLVRMKRTLAGVGAPVTVIADECSDAELYSSAYNIYKNDAAPLLGDTTRYRTTNTEDESYIIYYANHGINEVAIQYDRGEASAAEMTVSVSDDQSVWTEITPDTVNSELVNLDSWVVVTNYYGDLSGKYLKIELPNSLEFAIRKVYINGLDADALSAIGAQNTELREPVTIYVSNDGSDDNDGLTKETALATFDAAVSSALVPGDTIALACGDTFTGGAVLTSSGTADAPITVTSYGEGDKPIITDFSDTVGLSVTGEYVEVYNLAFTDIDGYSALDFYAIEAGETKGLKVENCYFYDINHTTDAVYDDSGAIHFIAKGAEPAWFDGVTVNNNNFESVARTAIYTASEWTAIDGNQTWGCRNLAYGDGKAYFAQNVKISNNRINNNGGDAILVIGTEDAVLEYNVVSNSHLLVELEREKSFANIWCHSSVGCVIRYNEVYGTTSANGGGDLWAYDIDHACTDCVVEYNYSHENEGGMVIVCGTDGTANSTVTNSIIRYNVSVDDGLGENRSAIDLSAGIDGVIVHNNTVISKNTDRFFTVADYCNDGVYVAPKNVKFYNNLFYGANSDTSAITYGGDWHLEDLTVEFYNNVFRSVDNLPWNYTNLWSSVNEGNITTTDVLLSGISGFINNTTITDGLASVYNTCTPVAGSVLLTGGYDMSKVYDEFVAVDYEGNEYEGNLIGAIGN